MKISDLILILQAQPDKELPVTIYVETDDGDDFAPVQSVRLYSSLPRAAYDKRPESLTIT